MRSSVRPWLRGLAGMAAVLVLAAGCGGDPAPTDQVPELATRLDAVDQAVSAHDDAATRSAVNRLEHTVYDARQSGDLDQERADEILSAAEALLQALPHAAPSQAPTSTTPSPTVTPSPTEKSEPEKPPKPDKHEEKPDKGPKPKPEEHGKGPGH